MGIQTRRGQDKELPSVQIQGILGVCLPVVQQTENIDVCVAFGGTVILERFRAPRLGRGNAEGDVGQFGSCPRLSVGRRLDLDFDSIGRLKIKGRPFLSDPARPTMNSASTPRVVFISKSDTPQRQKSKTVKVVGILDRRKEFVGSSGLVIVGPCVNYCD